MWMDKRTETAKVGAADRVLVLVIRFSFLWVSHMATWPLRPATWRMGASCAAAGEEWGDGGLFRIGHNSAPHPPAPIAARGSRFSTGWSESLLCQHSLAPLTARDVFMLETASEAGFTRDRGWDKQSDRGETMGTPVSGYRLFSFFSFQVYLFGI